MAEAFTGEIRMAAFNYAPINWAMCDGQLIPISQNTPLFSLVGTTFGGDGQSTFALPDFRGRGPIHRGTGAGLSDRVMGEAGGQEIYPLITSVAETPQQPSNPMVLSYTRGNQNVVTMPPFLVVNFIICLNGMFPNHP